MTWADDVVRLRDEELRRDEDCAEANLDVAAESGSYEEYAMKCALRGVEVLLTRADFEGDILRGER